MGESQGVKSKIFSMNFLSSVFENNERYLWLLSLVCNDVKKKYNQWLEVIFKVKN